MGQPRTRWVVGCMTGTSLDGLDAALVEIEGTGLAMKAQFRGLVSRAFEDDLRGRLLHLAGGGAAAPLEYMKAARLLGDMHADAAAELCETHLPKGTTLDFAVAHGQTIWHAPGERAGKQESRKAGNEGGDETRDTTGGAGMSWQLFDPWPIVRRLKVPVCYDLRQADLIAGGQGAPITPIADWVMYRSPTRHRTVANLGGVCNVTQLTPGCNYTDISGEDAFFCNLLLDGMVRELFPDRRYDEDGDLSSHGQSFECHFIADRLAELQRRLREVGKGTLGREDLPRAFIQSLIQDASTRNPEDLLASTVAYIVEELMLSVPDQVPTDLILAGGSAQNRTILQRLKAGVRNCDVKVMRTDDLGIPCEAREAMGFAVLGALSQDGVAITLPRVTGATEPGRAGVWAYP